MKNANVFDKERRDDPFEYGGEPSPVQPDELLAYQFETIRRRTELEPEQNLMVAVLEDAIVCFQKNVLAKTHKARMVFQEAENWILEDNENRLFAFKTICENLEIDADWLRKQLMEWKQGKIEEQSKYRPAA